MSREPTRSPNTAFLREHGPLLLQLRVVAERNDLADSNTVMLQLRQFGGALPQHLSPAFGIDPGPEGAQKAAT